MRTCTSAAPASKSICTICRVVEPRTIESSTTTSALARDLGERVELHADALLAHALLGLDERAADVAVLDQPLAERDARSRARSRSPPACPSRGSAARGRPRPAPRRRAARPCARARRAPRRRRGACRAARGRRTRRCRARRRSAGSTAWIECSAVVVDDARARRGRPRARTSAPTRSSAQVSEATTGSSPSRPSTSGRKPCGSRKANSLPSASPTTVAAPSSRAIAAATPPRAAARRRRSAPRSPRSRSVDASGLPDLARAAPSALTRLPLWPSATVRARPWWSERLRVRPGVAAGRRVARVPDRELAVQAGAGCARRRPAATRPRSRSAVSRPSSETAIPADSWPRCCSA